MWLNLEHYYTLKTLNLSCKSLNIIYTWRNLKEAAGGNRNYLLNTHTLVINMYIVTQFLALLYYFLMQPLTFNGILSMSGDSCIMLGVSCCYDSQITLHCCIFWICNLNTIYVYWIYNCLDILELFLMTPTIRKENDS